MEHSAYLEGEADGYTDLTAKQVNTIDDAAIKLGIHLDPAIYPAGESGPPAIKASAVNWLDVGTQGSNLEAACS